jgi:hypothetical protein
MFAVFVRSGCATAAEEAAAEALLSEVRRHVPQQTTRRASPTRGVDTPSNSSRVLVHFKTPSAPSRLEDLAVGVHPCADPANPAALTNLRLRAAPWL